MNYYTFEVIIEKEENNKGYYAYSPNLPGCFSNGNTFEETKHNIREAINLQIESMIAHGIPIPRNEKWVGV